MLAAYRTGLEHRPVDEERVVGPSLGLGGPLKHDNHVGLGLVEDFVGLIVVSPEVHLVSHLERIDVLLESGALALRALVEDGPVQGSPVDVLAGELVLEGPPVHSLGVVRLAGDGLLGLLQEHAVVDLGGLGQLAEAGVGVRLEVALEGAQLGGVDGIDNGGLSRTGGGHLGSGGVHVIRLLHGITPFKYWML